MAKLKTKPDVELEKIYRKYGIGGKTQETSGKSDDGKQNYSASSTSTKEAIKTDNSLKSIYKKYGVSGEYTHTNQQETPKSSETTKKPTDYSSAVKYLNDKGVQGASGIMTENEWRRRKGASGGTYQNYLDSVIGKYDNDVTVPQTTKPSAKKSTGEKILDSAGYIGEKLGRGVVDGIEGVTDFAWSLVGATGWGITSGFGLFENSWSDAIAREYNNINENDITDYWGNAEDRYDAAPDWLKEWGWLPETIGNLVPFMVETYYSGGTNVADDLYAAGKSVWDVGKKLLTNPDVHFGMSAGGSAIETALEKGANPITATTYGTAAGAVEVITEKLFGTGYAGTGIGASKRVVNEVAEETAEKTLLKKVWDSPVRKKIFDVGTEWIEEDIVAFADPILQKTTGVDANAEWATWSDYIESGTHGAILSIVMNSLGVPRRLIAKHGKTKAISKINESAEMLNGFIQDDKLKLQPLTNNVTEEEITARQKEVYAIALAYDNAVKKAVQNEQQTAKEQPITQPTSLEQTAMDVVSEYKNAVDENLVNFVQKAKNNTTDNKSIFRLNNVNARMAEEIEGLTGINAKNYGNVIKANSIRHIIKDHGVNGETDSSMAEDADIARIQYVIDNYDTMELLKEKSKEYRDKSQKPAPMIKISKRVNGTYYVVEAVPDTNRQELAVVTAYKNKATEQQTRDANSPHSDARNASADVTLSDNNISQSGNSVNGHYIQGSGNNTSLAERLETQSKNNEPLAVEDVKKATGFGEEGAKLVAELANSEGVTFSQAERTVKTAYMAGLANIEGTKVDFETDTQIDAFTAGKKDRVMQDLSAKENVKDVVINKESGFVAKDLPRDVTKTQTEILDILAKGTGVKMYVTKGLKGNAELNRKKGEVAIDFDFEREVGAEGNKQKVSIVFHAAHEAALHRVVELAPEEGSAFVYAMYNHLAGNDTSNFTLADQKRSAYAEQGVEISLAEAMEEVSANNILYLYNNNEAKFKNAIERIANGTDTKAKQGLRKYIDYINKIITNIRAFLAGKSAQERAEIRAELDEIIKLRDMFETAFAKTVKNKKEIQSKNSNTNSTQNLEIKVNGGYNKNTSYALKSKYNEYNTIGMQWAYDSHTQIGDLNLLYNKYIGKYVLVEATKEDVGFIELRVGTLEQMRKEREYYATEKDGLNGSEETVDKVLRDSWFRRNNNDGDNVDVGNRGTGKQNAELFEEKSNSNKTTDTQTTDGNLNEALSDKVHNFEKDALKGDEGEKKYSIKNISGTDKVYVKADEQVIKSQDPNDWESEIFNYVNKVVRKGRDFIIPMDNEESITITERTAWKLSDKGNFANDYYMVKGNASGVIDEIISVSKYLRSKPPLKTHSDGFARYGFDYRKAYFMDLDGKYYELQLSVGINEEGREAYNIGQIKQVAVPSKRLKGPKGTTTSNDNVPQKSDSVNTQFMQKSENNSQRKNSVKSNHSLKGTVVEGELVGLVKKYGAIPNGEKPHRDIQVPKKTAKDKKVSQTVRTILEAKATPDEAIPTIEKMVEDGIFSYDVYTDKQAINDADSYIKEYGWDKSLRDWFGAVEKGEVSKKTTAVGWALYNNAANIAATTTSETERNTAINTSLNILDAMVRHQRSAAQALQATRILKKLSPETQLYGVQKSIQALRKELFDKYGDKAPNLKIDERLAEQYLKAETQEEREAIEKEIYKDIGRQMPSRFIDKWNAVRYVAMLANARTHFRNIVGNAAFAPVVIAKDLTATAIEEVVYRVSGQKTVRGKALIVGSKADRELLKAAWNDYANVADIVSNGGKYSDHAMANKYIEEGRKIFKSKTLERVRKTNSDYLEKEDVWFSKPHYAYALAQYCKANNITAEQIKNGKAIRPARVYAIKEAQKATYKDTNEFSQWVSSFGRRGKSNNKIEKVVGPAVEGVLPYRRTPANILVRGVEYSPYGLLKGLSYDLVKVSKGEMTATEAIDNISAGLTGTGLLALGAFLAAQGFIRGRGEDDEEEREFKELMGHQPYALELPNGESRTLDWLAPEALPFFVGVNLWEATKGSEEKVNLSSILSAISNITEPMLEMSCLQSLNELVEGIGYAKSNDMSGITAILASATTSYLTQSIPTLLGQAERTGEENRMTTYIEKNDFLTKGMQYTLGKISSKIPFVDYHQIPYIDAWGRKEASGTALKRGFNNFLNPAYVSTIEESDMEKELLRLYEKTGDNGVFPERADKYFIVDGVRKDLTAEEYVRYATLKGEKSYKAVSDLVKSKAYKKLTDQEKAKAVQEVYDYANQKAKQAVGNYKPDSWVKKADEFGTNVGNYISFRTNVSSTRQNNGDKISKQQVVDIILDMAQNDSETWKMYLSMYDSDKDMYAYDRGIGGETYMYFLDSLNDVDRPTESGKYGTYTQEEAYSAIRQLEGLSRKEKAILWQSVNTSWKASKNPFR